MTSPTPMLAEPTAILGAAATSVREGTSPTSRTGSPARTPGGSPTTPGVRTADLLDELAVAYLQGEADEELVGGVLVALLVLGEIEPQVDIWIAFEDLAEAVRLRDGIAAGVLHWSEVADDLTCGDPSVAAHDIACGRVDDALTALLGGGR